MIHRVSPARSVFFFLLLLLSTAACTTALGPFASHRRREAVGARFLVRSAHWEDLTICLDREGTLLRLVAMSPAREPHAVSEIFGLAKGDYGVWEIGTIGRSTPVRFEDPPAS